ncbi:hypothetical protein PV396_41960 [Streptomyces sp. ME02-8801-2C]|uniref:hypothetical protein n=1 Tax=Streptomyces sp. ME02-8801-2C TaxID=3028680 RepID=UPI0029B6A9A0|nr:hypothetical protein [Streptomyces sp. ME02-8801-2C]MDX3458431.1 hypothetical protein [Streptomyces sp. ME02-8801-2C]
MRIPDHLATYQEEHWMPHVEPGIRLPTLRAREKYRQAQDQWAGEHGLDRTQFERLLGEQRKTASSTN